MCPSNYASLKYFLGSPFSSCAVSVIGAVISSASIRLVIIIRILSLMFDFVSYST